MICYISTLQRYPDIRCINSLTLSDYVLKAMGQHMFSAYALCSSVPFVIV